MHEYDKLADRLGYRFKNKEYMQVALTHRSVGRLNNERLEFLGDSILNFVIAAELYQRFPEASEGELSRLRSFLVKGDKLAEIARTLGLGTFIELGPGEMKSGGARRASILEDALEALIGAVYLDSDILEARQVVLSVYRPYLDDMPELDQLKDPKTRLQEYLQARKKPLPEYRIEETTGEQHQRLFKVSCRVEGLSRPTFGTASSRRKAEQESALRALAALTDGR